MWYQYTLWGPEGKSYNLFDKQFLSGYIMLGSHGTRSQIYPDLQKYIWIIFIEIKSIIFNCCTCKQMYQQNWSEVSAQKDINMRKDDKLEAKAYSLANIKSHNF